MALEDNLLAKWKFNGDLLDSSGNGHHLTKVGTVPFVADKDGVVGNAVDGMDGYNYLYNADNFIDKYKDITISIWTDNKNNTEGYHDLIKTDGVLNGFNYGIAIQRNGDKIYFGTNAAVTYMTIPDGWFNVIVQYEWVSAKWTIFLNAVEKNFISAALWGVNNILQIGGSVPNGAGETATLDEICIYNSLLTSAEKHEIVNRGVNYQPPTIATPTSNLNTGSYEGTQLLELNCATVGATIRYTLTGIEPNESSMEYTDSIALTTGIYQLRAKAFLNGIGSDTLSKNITITEVTQMAEIQERLILLGPADLAIRAFTDPAPILTAGAIVVGKKYIVSDEGTGIIVNTSDTPARGEVFTATATTVTWNGGALSLINETAFIPVAALQDKTLTLMDEKEYADSTIEQFPGTVMARMCTKDQTKGTITLISYNAETYKTLMDAKDTVAGGILVEGMTGKQVPYYEMRIRPQAFPDGSQDINLLKVMITCKENQNFTAKEDSKRTLEMEFIGIPLLTGINKGAKMIKGEINSIAVEI